MQTDKTEDLFSKLQARITQKSEEASLPVDAPEEDLFSKLASRATQTAQSQSQAPEMPPSPDLPYPANIGYGFVEAVAVNWPMGRKQKELAQSLNDVMRPQKEVKINPSPYMSSLQQRQRLEYVDWTPEERQAQLEKVFQISEEMAKLPQSEGTKAWEKIFSSLPDNASNSDKIKAFAKGMVINPEIARDFAMQSLASNPETIAISTLAIGVGSLLGQPWLGGIIGSMASTYAAEDVMGVLSVLESNEIDISSQEALEELMSNPEKMDYVNKKIGHRAGAMALFEGIISAASFGIAKGMTGAGAGAVKRATGKVLGGAIEVAGEPGSETAGIIASQSGPLSERSVPIEEPLAELAGSLGMKAPQIVNILKNANKENVEADIITDEVQEVVDELTESGKSPEKENSQSSDLDALMFDDEGKSKELQSDLTEDQAKIEEASFLMELEDINTLDELMEESAPIPDTEVNKAVATLNSKLNEINENESLSQEQKDFAAEVINEELERLNNYEFVTKTEASAASKSTEGGVHETTPQKTKTLEDVGLDTEKEYEVSSNKGEGVVSANVKVSDRKGGKKVVVLTSKSEGKVTSTAILGTPEEVIEKGVVNFDNDGNPSSVTIPFSGGREVTIHDPSFAKALVKEELNRTEISEEEFSQEFDEFVGDEEVEVKQPLNERTDFTSVEKEMTTEDFIDSTPTTEEMDKSDDPTMPETLIEENATEEEISEDGNEESDSSTDEEGGSTEEGEGGRKPHHNKKLSTEQNKLINELIDLTDEGKEHVDKKRNRNSEKNKHSILTKLKDAVSTFATVIDRISQHNSEIGSKIRGLITTPLRGTLAVAEHHNRHVDNFRKFMASININELDRLRTGIVSAAAQFYPNDIEKGLTEIERSINNALEQYAGDRHDKPKKLKGPSVWAKALDWAVMNSAAQAKSIAVYRKAKKEQKILAEIREDLKQGKPVLNTKQQMLYDKARDYYNERFDLMARSILMNRGPKAYAEFLSNAREDYFHMKALGGWTDNQVDSKVGKDKRESSVMAGLVGSAKKRTGGERVYYEHDIFKNIKDYTDDFWVESHLTPTIKNVERLIKDKAFVKVVGKDNANSLMSSLAAFERQKRKMISNSSLTRFVESKRSSWISTTLSSPTQIIKQTFSGMAAAGAATMGSADGMIASIKSVSPLMTVTDPSGKEISLDDWIHEHVPELMARVASLEHKYGVERSPAKTPTPGSFEEKWVDFAEKTSEGAIRYPDYVAARAVFTGAFKMLGGKFESPNKEIIQEALAYQEPLQGANDLALGGRIFLHENEAVRFIGRSSLTFMGFALAQLTTLATAAPNVHKSGRARRMAGGALASMVGFTYSAFFAKALAKGMMDNLDEYLFGKDREDDEEELSMVEKLSKPEFHRYIILKGLMEGTVGTIPILGTIAAKIINDVDILGVEEQGFSDGEEQKQTISEWAQGVNNEKMEGMTLPPLMFPENDYGIGTYTNLFGPGYGEPINKLINLGQLAYMAFESNDKDAEEIYIKEAMMNAIYIDFLRLNKKIPFKGAIIDYLKNDLKHSKKDFMDEVELMTGKQPRSVKHAEKLLEEESL